MAKKKDDFRIKIRIQLKDIENNDYTSSDIEFDNEDEFKQLTEKITNFSKYGNLTLPILDSNNNVRNVVFNSANIICCFLISAEEVDPEQEKEALVISGSEKDAD